MAFGGTLGGGSWWTEVGRLGGGREGGDGKGGGGGGELVGVDSVRIRRSGWSLAGFFFSSLESGKLFGDIDVNGTAIAFLPGKLDC